jgi:hypothetical protein
MRVPTAPISGGSNTSSRSTTKIIIYIRWGEGRAAPTLDFHEVPHDAAR